MRIGCVLVMIAPAMGCASSSGAKHGSPSQWPAGSAPGMRWVTGVKFNQPGKITVSNGGPVYAVLLELRPKLDSLDLRPATNVGVGVPLTGSADLYTSVETVDPPQRSTVSTQATNCTTVQMGAGDPGREFCPISRTYAPETGRPWQFRNRVFLVLSDQPLPTPLPQSVRWSARSTVPPVASGAKWTAIEL